MNAKPLSVWLVDDDSSIRWVLEKALKGGGMHAKCFELATGAFRQILRKTRKQILGGFNQNNPRLCRINVPKIPLQHRARQFRKGAREFHARRPATDNHNRH